MSDLKHQTPEQLRSIIRWCSETRVRHREEKARKQDMIKQLEQEIDHHGMMDNNIGQKEVWARKYLAEKEIAK